jgi:30S ribosomal protein S31
MNLKAGYLKCLAFFCPNLRILKNINMGRGDAKTKKGKIFKGSFGKTRPAKTTKKAVAKKA